MKYSNNSGGNRAATSLDVRYSYSGSDVRGWWIVDKVEKNGASQGGFDSRLVESLSTVSVQVYEPIGRARALGSRGVKGFASSIREIAGTIVVTVIDDNPLKGLLDLTAQNNQKVKWSRDLYNGFGTGYFTDFHDKIAAGGLGDSVELVNRIAPLIPTFNLFLEYVSEYFDPNNVPDYSAVAFTGGDVQRLDKVDNAVKTQLVEKGTYTQDNLTRRGNDKFTKLALQENEVILDKKDFEEEYLSSQKKEFNFGHTKNKLEIDVGKANLTDSQKRRFNTVGVYIEGMRFISEGIVTSVNDMVTEISYQFIAQDVKPISKYNRLIDQTDAVTNAIIRNLSDPKSSTYKFLKELEQENALDEQHVKVAYNPESEHYKIIVETDGDYDSLVFTNKAKGTRVDITNKAKGTKGDKQGGN